MVLNKFIGDRNFYKKILAIAMPIMLQNGITNFVSLLDNIMVGKIGPEEMTGVAIVNQLLFVFNLCVFGGFSGAGIFTAQFFGKGDMKGVRDSMRYKVWLCVFLSVAALLIFGLGGEWLSAKFLYESDSDVDIAKTLAFAKHYINIMLLGIVPFAVAQMYSSTLRETGKTVPPMVCGISAVLVNLVLNYVLIFGHFGFPKLGVNGAAIATVVSRYVECFSIVIWTHAKKKENSFITGIYRSLRVPRRTVIDMSVKGLPLLFNEAFWSLGVTMMAQCFSTRGLDVVGAHNICNTISNVFSMVFISLGSAIAIIIGNLLGASKMEEARDTDNKLLAFTVMSSSVIAVVMAALSGVFPQIYNTTDSVKDLATFFIIVMACYMPLNAFINGAYFTIRSGGKTYITFLFDSAYIWVVNVSIAFLLTRYTSLSIYPIFIICYVVDIIKAIIGIILIKKGTWLSNIVDDKK